MGNWRKAATILCGLVFLASAIAKLVSMRAFELYVFSLGMASFDLTSLAARLLLLLEGITGLWFLSGWQLKWARVLAWAQLAFFSGFLVWRMAVGDSQSCHCFGELVDMNPLQSLLKNALLAVLVGFSATELYSKPLKPLWLALISGAAAVALFCYSPPDWYYRRFGEPSQYIHHGQWDQLMATHPVQGRQVVAFMSTRCEHCQDCARKLHTMLEQADAQQGQVQLYFLMVSDSTETEVAPFFEKYMNGHSYPFQVLHPTSFLPVTSGAMPVVVLSEEGSLVQEYDYQTLNEQEIRDFLHYQR